MSISRDTRNSQGYRAAPAADFRHDLNTEQRRVVEEGDGFSLVLAGAGSGKTRTIVYRVAHLLDRGVPADRILLLTFTNKAADEMMARIREMMSVSGVAAGLWGGTFHSVANRLLRLHGSHLGYGRRFSILDETDSRALIKATIKEAGCDPKGRKFPSPAVVSAVISYARNSMRDLDEVIESRHPGLLMFREDIRRVAERYDRKKRDSESMDFDDLLCQLLRLLKEVPEVRERLRERFRHILVDEYQDTNAVQAEIIAGLAGRDSNVLVVGDDAQSIYSFRAAEIRNILDFPERFGGTRTFRLETNYRSTPEILTLANDIISRNAAQFPKELRSVRDNADRPAVIALPSARQEAEFVAGRIRQLIEEEGVPESDIAVLFRATHHSQALEFELMTHGMEYEYRGGAKFFDRAHVKDVLAFLRLCHNLRDEASWRRVLGLQPGIGEVSAGRIFGLVRTSRSLTEAVRTPVSETCGRRVVQGWAGLIRILGRLVETGGDPAELVRAVTDSDYAAYLETEYPNAAERFDDLEQLASFAERYETLADFLSEITLNDSLHQRGHPAAGDASRLTGQAPRLVLSTIHQAKGLEWDTVFLIHLNASSFPNRRAALEEGGLEEERRLFYVAATRAKRQLVLSFPASGGYDSYVSETPSPFLTEIDPSCLDTSLVDGTLADDADGPVVFLDDGDDMERVGRRTARSRSKSLLIDV